MLNCVKLLFIFLNIPLSYNLKFTNTYFSIKKLTDSKKFLCISPSGINGFYTLGISSYILNNYDINKYSFIGGSSGSWNSLLCSYKYNHTNLIEGLLEQKFFDKPKSISAIQSGMYNYILNNYKASDFELDKLYISVTEIEKYKLSSLLINDFCSLKDALNCCISSSHIPLITSDNLINIYNKKIVFDGGFSEFPPLGINEYFTISSSTFKYSNLNKALCDIISKNISNTIIKDLYYQGYKDSQLNKEYLNKYFVPLKV